MSLGLRSWTVGVLNSSGRGNENEENRVSSKALVMITYVYPLFERGTLPMSQYCLLHGRRTYLQIPLRLRKFLAMYPDSPTWCSIAYRSENESHVPHHPRSTYFNNDPSDRPSVDGVVGSSTSEAVPFQRNVPKPLPSGLSCDCTNSAKYTLSPLCFNRTADGNEDRSVNAAKVQVPKVVCTLRGKVLQLDTKKKWKTRGIGRT